MYPLIKKLVTEMDGLEFFGISFGWFLFKFAKNEMLKINGSEPGLHDCGSELYCTQDNCR